MKAISRLISAVVLLALGLVMPTEPIATQESADEQDEEDEQEDDPEDLVESSCLSVVDLSTDPDDDQTEDDCNDAVPESDGGDDSTDSGEDSGDNGGSSNDLDEGCKDVDLVGDCSNTDAVSKFEVDHGCDDGSDGCDEVTNVLTDSALHANCIHDLEESRHDHQDSYDGECPSNDLGVVEE